MLPRAMQVNALRRYGALAASALALAGCGGAAANTPSGSSSGSGSRSSSGSSSSRTHETTHAQVSRPAPPPYPQLLGSATGSAPTGFVPAVRWRGQTAAWIARSSAGAGLLSFNQRLVTLALHSGTVDAGSTGWHFGPMVVGPERRQLIAAFNGGFKLDTGSGGFQSFGRTAAALRPGLGSIVTYRDGSTDIGSWRAEVPAPGRPVASVRQNLTLLIDHGRAATNLDCLLCWGATLGGVSDPARSALGVTADGRLIWTGGEHLTVAGLAATLLGAGVVRAVELDINPEWVAGYLYRHHGASGPLGAVPVAAGQSVTPDGFLAPYARDFFTVVGR